MFYYTYKNIISIENLLLAWKEFLNGKRGRKDVQEFETNLMGNIIDLHKDLTAKSYHHSLYSAFNISDPKPRNIHKANVRDRLLHHAIYRKLYPFFDRLFIADSHSCRFGKGTHEAMNRLRKLAYKCSHNHRKTIYVLKCDIRKFFAFVDHTILLHILKKHIPDKDTIWLLTEIIGSFSSSKVGVGLPLGNLTSQLLVNVYMNEFDQFIKHRLKIKYYVRFADDFVILSDKKSYLENLILEVNVFLSQKLKLSLHPTKLFIKTFATGVDFLGWVHFSNHRVLRTATKRRMMRMIRKHPTPETVASYLGLLKHGNTNKLQERIMIGEV
jgi:retron-type reverse transcriptase